ncbi:PREDICTED: receptor-transporting protein 2-like [Gavialis gangeticus]|uniref:receptor-transporting protein 2-like n=1 Tax=Gavialis gangeticus TaxID=94835 RepID=UPI00092F45FE|nr:PREDICTED: receptor-transporting protein 2-like [Gavialis gangeticus]
MEMWKQIFLQKMQQVHPGDKWALKLDNNLQPNVLGPGWMQFLQQHAFGRFQCLQCHHAWQSAQVHVLFHIHLDRRRRRGWVKMKIFRQECKKCLLVMLEEPQFSSPNVKRVLDSLGQKIHQKCYGEAVHPNSVPATVAGDPTKEPHDSTCCEACGLGVCSVKHETQTLPDVIVGSTCTPPEQWEQTGVATGVGSGFSWRQCCCYSCCVLAISAVLFLLLLYFTPKK